MTVHQIFFKFPPDYLPIETFPDFLHSKRRFQQCEDWDYKLWDEKMVKELILDCCPDFLPFYEELRFDIQRVDVAKYLIAHFVGGLIADLDVFPWPSKIDFIDLNLLQVVNDSNPKRTQNDIFYCPKGALPGILESLKENYYRCKAIPIYKTWRFRFVLQTTGPMFWTRFLKKLPHVKKNWVTRAFTDKKYSHLSVYHLNAPFYAFHRSTWKNSLRAPFAALLSQPKGFASSDLPQSQECPGVIYPSSQEE